MSRCPQHTFQILTKRPERALEYYNYALKNNDIEFFKSKNIWLGVSTENQETADERIPLLLQIPARVRWLSCEPLLSEIILKEEWLKNIHWVVVGGESGHGARPFHINNAIKIMEQCKAAGVPFFMKQLGSNPYRNGLKMKVEGKGGDFKIFPKELQIREYPKIN